MARGMEDGLKLLEPKFQGCVGSCAGAGGRRTDWPYIDNQGRQDLVISAPVSLTSDIRTRVKDKVRCHLQEVRSWGGWGVSVTISKQASRKANHLRRCSRIPTHVAMLESKNTLDSIYPVVT